MCVCVFYTPWAASIPAATERAFLLKTIFVWICVWLVFNWLTSQTWKAVLVCITNQLLVCFFFFFLFKQLFETTTGILSTISWKFVVVCLDYNWLSTLVLTFQTALSTFILMTHLCIDFSFKNACCERHRYPVCLMWKENVFCFVKELSSIVVNTWTEVAEL